MAKAIRVLHVFGSLDVGGAENRTMDVYRRIDRSKIQFDFVVHIQEEGHYDEEVKRLGSLVFSFPKYKVYKSKEYKKYWNTFLVKHPEYEIIHIHTTSIAKSILSVAANKVPILITHSRNSMQTGFLKNMYIKFSKKSIQSKSTHMLAVSEKAARYIYGDKLVNQQNVQIVKNGINASEFKYSESKREEMRRNFNIGEEVVIGHIGRFVEQKNHDFLLKIFVQYKKIQPAAKLMLIGIGPLQEIIKSKVKELDLEKDVLFLGLRKDVKDILQAIDLLLFPSLFEGLPGVVLEAQAAGLPALVSSEMSSEVKITNFVEMLELGKSAIEWAEKMKELLEKLTRRDTYEELLEAGYDIQSVVRWYETFYLNALLETRNN